MHQNVNVILRPFCVVCGAPGLGAGPCWRPRPSPAGPGPRSNAASAAEGSHSGHAGEETERQIKMASGGAVQKNLSVFVETWSGRRLPAGFVWLGSAFEHESMETGADLSREDLRLLDYVWQSSGSLRRNNRLNKSSSWSSRFIA